MWLLVIEWAVILLVGVFWFTQIFWPLVNQRPMLPMFNKKQVELENKLSEERQRAVEESIAEEIRSAVKQREQKGTDAH